MTTWTFLSARSYRSSSSKVTIFKEYQHLPIFHYLKNYTVHGKKNIFGISGAMYKTKPPECIKTSLKTCLCACLNRAEKKINTDAIINISAATFQPRMINSHHFSTEIIVIITSTFWSLWNVIDWFWFMNLYTQKRLLTLYIIQSYTTQDVIVTSQTCAPHEHYFIYFF